MTMTMMMSSIPCAVLSITLVISATSAFSSSNGSSGSIASSRRSTRPTAVAITTELSSTMFDIDNDEGNSSHHMGVLKKTVADVIVTTSVAIGPVDVPQQQQQQQQILTDGSNTYDNIKKVLNMDKKMKKRYAIVLGRLMILCVSFLPLITRHHEMQMGMHTEEYLIQLFLMGISIQPLKKSVTVVKCITNSKTENVEEECQLEFEDLEDALDIDHKQRNSR